MGRISKIAQGWLSYLVGSADEQEQERAKICSTCPEAKVGAFEQMLPDFSLVEVKGLKCKACGCPLSAKIRSTEDTCPLGKWK